jgi:hypothetical protein
MPPCSSDCDWWAFSWFLYVAASACTYNEVLGTGPILAGPPVTKTGHRMPTRRKDRRDVRCPPECYDGHEAGL